MKGRRIVVNVLVMLLGIALIVMGFFGIVDNALSAFGVGFLVVGTANFIRGIKYKTNPEYKEKVDTANNDERNRYISMKAWAVSGYISVLAAAVTAITFAAMSKREYMQLCAYFVCVVLLVYVVSYYIISKKN